MKEPINCTGLELFTYLAVLAEGYLPTFYSDTNPSVPSRSMVIASKSYQQGKKTVHFPGFQFSMTLQNLTGSHGEESLMSSRVDSLAKTSHAPEKVKESTATDQAFGMKCSVSFAKFDQDTFTLKTAQCSLLEDLIPSSVDLPIAGTMLNGALFQQVPLAHVINATGFGFLPDGETKRQMIGTPTACMSVRSSEFAKGRTPNPAEFVMQERFATPTTMDALPPKSEQALLREMTVARPGRSKPANLRDHVSNMDNWKMWPTPKASEPGMSAKCSDRHYSKSTHLTMQVAIAEGMIDAETGNLKMTNDAVAKFPTPIARDYKDGSFSPEGKAKRDGQTRGKPLSEVIGGRLNPDWVEWLMLWPIGWTALEPLQEGAFYSMQPHDEPEDLPRVTSNCPNRAARLRAIGNGQVPMCAATAFKQLKERLHDENR